MLLLTLLTETPVQEEVSALPQALSFAFGAFATFSILLFAVTRLNPDR